MENSKISVTHLKKNFGKLEVLKGISLEVKEGEVVCLIGPSGSGKSTLLKLLLKELEPTSGRIVVNDMDLGKMPRRYVPKYRRKLGVVFQDFRLLKDLTVFENVAFAQRVIGVPGRVIRDTVPEMLRLVGLSAKYKAYPAQLSGGEQQMLAMGRALMSHPKLIVLDEPSMGLSPIYVNEIFDIIQKINEDGVTVLLVEQNAKKALSIANRAYVLETGSIVLSGDAAKLMNDDSVKKAYLSE